MVLDAGASRALALPSCASTGACASQLAGQPAPFFVEQPSAELAASNSALALRQLLSPRSFPRERTSCMRQVLRHDNGRFRNC